jgi:hypothetical protein
MFVLGCWYCMVDYVPSPDGPGFTPALPEATAFVLLANPHHGARWGIFACGAKVEFSEQVQAVPTDIESVLESGRRYPPALALARDEAAMFPDGATIDRVAFAIRYAERVVHHLNRQPDAPYMIAEAVVHERGYLNRGQHYWVLRYLRGEGEVRWVSDDFQVYQNQASNFRLSADQLEALLLPFESAL